MSRLSRSLRVATAIVLAATGLAAAPDTSADAARPLRIVQLGDSYAAGNGAGSYLETTCYRSSQNYGAQVAARLGADYVNVACSGGTIRDILQARKLGDEFERTATFTVDRKVVNDPDAVWLRLARKAEVCGTTSQPDLYYAYRITAGPTWAGDELTATAGCQLTAEPQIEAVTEQTDVILVTVGGHSIGFTQIVGACLLYRSPTLCPYFVGQAMAATPQMVEDTKAALKAAQERSGGRAQVYLVGYPFLLNTASYGIPEGAPTYDMGAGLDSLQVLGDQLAAQGMEELNAEPGPNRFHFVNVKAAWSGHLHGLDPHVVPDNSNAWLVPLGGSAVPDEWVHPNPSGWAATAEAVYEALAS